MEINWIIVGTVVAGVVALLVFIVWRNRKDQQEYEDYLGKNDRAIQEDEIDWGV